MDGPMPRRYKEAAEKREKKGRHAKTASSGWSTLTAFGLQGTGTGGRRDPSVETPAPNHPESYLKGPSNDVGLIQSTFLAFFVGSAFNRTQMRRRSLDFPEDIADASVPNILGSCFSARFSMSLFEFSVYTFCCRSLPGH
jgi:hypothetical protein